MQNNISCIDILWTENDPGLSLLLSLPLLRLMLVLQWPLLMGMFFSLLLMPGLLKLPLPKLLNMPGLSMLERGMRMCAILAFASLGGGNESVLSYSTLT